MTAEELLMMSDDIETYSVDDSLVIDPESRVILTPVGGLVLGVESDQDSERVYFVCPRFVGDNIDLSSLQLRVIYRNAKGEKDYRICTDVKVDGDKVRFSWLLSRKVTRYKGKVNFIVCAIRTQADGTIKNEWNTTLAEGIALEGLEIDIQEEEFEEPKDIVLQLLEMLNQKEAELLEEVENLRTDVKTDIEATKQNAMDEVEAKGNLVLDTIPEDYTFVSNLAKENKQLKANAIKRTYTGETIVSTDSSDSKFEGLRVFGRSEQESTTGKNLFDADTYNANGMNITFEVEGGRKLYRNSGLGNSSRWGIYDASGTLLGTFADYNFKIDNPITLPDMASYIKVSNDILQGDIYVGYDSDTSFEKFTGNKPSPSVEYPQPIENIGDDGSIDVGVYGKNFVNIHGSITNIYTKSVINGESITVTAERTKGTCRATIPGDYPLNVPLRLSFDATVLSGSSIVDSGYSVVYFRESNGGNETANVILRSNVKHYSISLRNGIPNKDYVLWLYICATNTSDEIVSIKFENIQLELGLEETEYEPYKEPQTLITTVPNGLPGIPLGTTIPDAIASSEALMSGVWWCEEEQQYYIGDTVEHGRGKYVQRIKTLVFDGITNKMTGADENYSSRSGNNYAWVPIADKLIGGACIATVGMSNDIYYEEGWISSIYNDSMSLTLSDERTGITKEDGKAAIFSKINAWLQKNPVTISYLLINPIETDLPSKEISAFKALHSNYPTTTILNDSGAWTEVSYNADTKNHIEQNYVPKSEFESVLDRLSAVEQALA